MIRNIQRHWFEVWGNEEAQNRILKGLLIAILTVCSIQTVAILILALRSPVLIAVTETESRVLSVSPPKPELLQREVRRTIEAYTLSHYNWDAGKIEKQFKNASKFVAPQFQKKFLQANAEQQRIAKEKRLSQTFYISDLQIDLKMSSALVQGDRILLVENLRAVSPLTLQIHFDYGARTTENPEGIYVTEEKLISGGAR